MSGQHQQLRAFASAFGPTGRSFLDPRSCLSSLDWPRGLSKAHQLSTEKWSLEISRPEVSALMSESWSTAHTLSAATSSSTFHSAYGACSAPAASSGLFCPTNSRSGHEAASETSHDTPSVAPQVHRPLSQLVSKQHYQEPQDPSGHSSQVGLMSPVSELSVNPSLVSPAIGNEAHSSLVPSFFLPAAHEPYAYHQQGSRASYTAPAASGPRSWYTPYAFSLSSPSAHHPYAFHRFSQPSLVHDASYSTAACSPLNAQYSSLLRTAAQSGSSGVGETVAKSGGTSSAARFMDTH